MNGSRNADYIVEGRRGHDLGQLEHSPSVRIRISILGGLSRWKEVALVQQYARSREGPRHVKCCVSSLPTFTYIRVVHVVNMRGVVCSCWSPFEDLISRFPPTGMSFLPAMASSVPRHQGQKTYSYCTRLGSGTRNAAHVLHRTLWIHATVSSPCKCRERVWTDA